LWKKGLLGDNSPHVLLDTIIFYNGLYFALHSGKEYCQLRSSLCQIEVVEVPGERLCLRYEEELSKNRPGGIKGQKMKPNIFHHSNTLNPERCFVKLFKLYTDLFPENWSPDAFYFPPSSKPISSCWYTVKPLGHNTLHKMVNRLCEKANIFGSKTNHSLHANAATQLYKARVDKQLVMKRTGHRSLEGVHNYKQTSDTQRVALSDILNNKKACTSDNQVLVPLSEQENPASENSVYRKLCYPANQK